MLPGHEECNHHVGNLLVWDWLARLVFAVHQVPNHIAALLRVAVAPLLDDARVDAAHLGMGLITLAVVWKGRPGEEKVDWRKPHVEIMIKRSKLVCQLFSHLVALKSPAGREDGNLCHGLGHIHQPALSIEHSRSTNVIDDLGRDEGDVAFEGLLRQAEFDKFLLLHELRVGAVIDDVGAEDGRGQGAVNLLGVEVLMFSVKNEFVAIEAKVASDFPAQECKGEYVAVLHT